MSPERSQEPNKLVLCFDGTGNQFSGSSSDTNVVKILNKLDRHHPNQYHYYQTGIGTYRINESSIYKTGLGKLRSSISQTIDQGIGTTFDAHVLAGYRFLMRFHKPGDKIYMFGFSRGAFTAKFLARMIHTVGLLCKGNEEMVPFAYRLYQRYLAGEVEDFKDTSSSRYHRKPAWKAEKGEKKTHSQPNGNHETAPEYHGYEYEMARDEITAFSNTFCRKEHTDADGIMEETNVKVYFLGIWDCVNSVSVLEREAPMPVPVKGTARYVRHAVAVDECRVKFKPALVAQDIRSATQSNEDIKEVWFPGCHGDIGGGWPSEVDHHIADNTTSRRERFKKLWLTRKAKAATKSGLTDAFQLSDIPLAWMMREIELVGEADPSAALSWCPHADSYKRRYRENREEALRGVMHHSLHFGSGTGVFSVMMWKCLEYVPFITRWELEDDEWVRTRFPLNKGDTRDIPHDAVLHESLIWRLRNLVAYCPQNNHGGQLPPCLKQQGLVASVTPLVLDENGDDADHQTYVFTANEGYENGGHSSRASK